jgi:nicotinate phosphoribosyltransferase
VQAVRLDSGDLAALAHEARTLLDSNGRAAVQILASGDLDEWRIQELLGAGAPIDAFGVGTELVTSRDAPALSMVYKLVELDGKGCIKLSPGKKTYPLAKQIYRQRDAESRFAGDHVTGAEEHFPGEPLLRPVLRSGRLVAPLPSLSDIRARCVSHLVALPDALRRLDDAPSYPISYSDFLEREAVRLGVNAGHTNDPSS